MPRNEKLEYAPGTVRLELLTEASTEITLHPKPSRDPNDPLNWPLWRKNLNFALVCYYTLMVFVLIDVGPVTWAPMDEELTFGFDIINNSWGAGCGALALGAIAIIPLALKFGRRPVYLFSTALQCGLTVWYARTFNVFDLMATNITTNFVGALAEVLIQMTVADMFFVHQRGRYNTVYFLVLMIGVMLPGIPGGYVSSSQGWRWVWWWCVILLGLGFLAFLFLYEETMFTRVLESETIVIDEDMLKTTMEELEVKEGIEQLDPSTQIVGSVDLDPSIPKKTYREKFAFWSTTTMPWKQVLRSMYQPFPLLVRFPAVCFVAVEYGCITSTATVTLATVATVMPAPPYNFSPPAIGLMGIPSFIGILASSVIYWALSDRIILILSKRNGGIFEPEMRLWLPVLCIPLIPAGLLMVGIGLNNGLHWIVPAVGLGILGFGVPPLSSAALTYLTDSYTDITGVAFVGVTFVRNVISMAFVFAQTPWVASTGLTSFYVAFACIVTAVFTGNLVFIFYGKRFRAHTAHRYRLYVEALRG